MIKVNVNELIETYGTIIGTLDRDVFLKYDHEPGIIVSEKGFDIGLSYYFSKSCLALIVGDRLKNGDGDSTRNVVVSHNLEDTVPINEPHSIYVPSNHPESVVVAQALEEQGILVDTGEVVNYGYANSVTAKKYLLNISDECAEAIGSTLE